MSSTIRLAKAAAAATRDAAIAKRAILFFVSISILLGRWSRGVVVVVVSSSRYRRYCIVVAEDVVNGIRRQRRRRRPK